VFKKPTLAKIKIIATKFETLHGIIPYVLGAIHEGTLSVKFGIYVCQTTNFRGDIK
jgi:hypothetical protein